MRSSTLSIATLLLAACSLTGALAADDDQSAAPLATAGTTPNNLTGAGAMFGNKYQGDVSRKKRERESWRKKRFSMRGGRATKKNDDDDDDGEKLNLNLGGLFFFFSSLSLSPFSLC